MLLDRRYKIENGTFLIKKEKKKKSMLEGIHWKTFPKEKKTTKKPAIHRTSIIKVWCKIGTDQNEQKAIESDGNEIDAISVRIFWQNYKNNEIRQWWYTGKP